MKAHELARKLLEGPDEPVIYNCMDFGLTEVTDIVPWRKPAESGEEHRDFAWQGPDKYRNEPALELV